MRSPEWREKHPNFISPPPVPRFGDYVLDIPDPELVPHRDWDAWALRAWVEKRRHKEKTDAAWVQRQADIGRCITVLLAPVTASTCNLQTVDLYNRRLLMHRSCMRP